MKQQIQNTRLILVVDESPLLESFAKGLTCAGYQVLIAHSAEVGLKLINSDQPPHLAILGMRLPDMSGIALAQQLKLLKIPWIFLSDYQDEAHLKQMVDGGAMGYLLEPVDVTQAVPTIQVAIHQARELMECKQTELRLSDALETANLVNIVIGLLMERNRLCRQDAYEMLRTKARSEQRKVKSVAAELLAAWENLNLIEPSRKMDLGQ